MKTFLLVLNAIGLLLSIALFVGTFLPDQTIARRMEGVVMEKAREKTDGVMESLGKGLESPVTRKFLPDSLEEMLGSEVGGYSEDPDGWLRDVAASGTERFASFRGADIENPIARKLVEGVVQGLSKVKGYVVDSLDGLRRDVRIFSGTNALAFVVAFVLIGKVPRGKPFGNLLGISAMLSLATITSALAYLDRSPVMTILLNSYIGWGYPIVVVGLFCAALLTSFWKKSRS